MPGHEHSVRGGNPRELGRDPLVEGDEFCVVGASTLVVAVAVLGVDLGELVGDLLHHALGKTRRGPEVRVQIAVLVIVIVIVIFFARFARLAALAVCRLRFGCALRAVVRVPVGVDVLVLTLVVLALQRLGRNGACGLEIETRARIDKGAREPRRVDGAIDELVEPGSVHNEHVGLTEAQQVCGGRVEVVRRAAGSEHAGELNIVAAHLRRKVSELGGRHNDLEMIAPLRLRCVIARRAGGEGERGGCAKGERRDEC